MTMNKKIFVACDTTNPRKINKIIIESKNVQNHSKEQIQREKDRSKYSCKGDVSSEVYWIYTE